MEHDCKWHTPDTAIGTQCTETHAYGIPHINELNVPPCKFTDVVSANHELFSIKEINEKENTDIDVIDTLSNVTECLTENESKKSPQFIYGNEPFQFFTEPPSKLKSESTIDQKDTTVKEKAEETDSNLKYSPKIDHVYEEVNAFECDIMDYYEKYSPTTAKTLINTLFLPRHKICRQCANSRNSPVYSDQLIYSKKQVLAKEIHLYQSNDTVGFKYSRNSIRSSPLYSQYDNIQHCLLVHNYTKTNASSIFYFYGPPRDVFDLKTTLKPNILLLNGDTTGIVNTEFYHRYANNFYTRISNNGIEPAAFSTNQNNILSTIKHVGYNTDLQNWMNYRNDVSRSHGLKHDNVIEHRANRSSLLMLEPLLLMPDLTTPRYRHGKNRISQPEHMKIVKIVIAYTLSFFILATITFYIVYFT